MAEMQCSCELAAQRVLACMPAQMRMELTAEVQVRKIFWYDRCADPRHIIRVNAWLLEPIITAFPDHVPGKYVLACLMMYVDKGLGHTLFRGSHDGERLEQAIDHGQILKIMLQLCRSSCRRSRF